VLRDLKGRFRRGSGPSGVGSGLGLAIVDTIMRQAGGTVALKSPAEGRQNGFEISLKFPGAI
jgi:two-component system OmpR family sensor kinase